MVSATLGPILSTAHLDQGHDAHRVQQKGNGNGHQADQREEQGEGQVAALRADVEKAPGARHLHVVAANAREGQQSYAASHQPDHQHHGDGPALGHAGGACKGTVDANEALRGHGGSEQQWTQSIEDHGHAHKVAEVAVWIQPAPVKVRNVEGDHDGAGDQEAHGVGDNQATQEDQERAGAAMSPPEGLEENYKGDEVGDHSQSGEDG